MSVLGSSISNRVLATSGLLPGDCEAWWMKLSASFNCPLACVTSARARSVEAMKRSPRPGYSMISIRCHQPGASS